MRLMTKALLGIGTSIALAGGALAADKAVHVAEIPLGDGQVAQVRYLGDTPRRISIVPIAAVPVQPIAMADPGFAAFDRMFAEMDARADAMMRQAAAMAQAPSGNSAYRAAARNLPAGTVSYSFVSTSSADGCTRTVQTSYPGAGAAPRVVRQSSAGCREADRAPTPVSAPRAAAPAKVVPVKAPSATKPFDPRTI